MLMAFEEYVKKQLKKTATRMNNIKLGNLPKLDDEKIVQQVNTTYKITKFFWILTYCIVFSFTFVKILPDKIGFEKTLLVILSGLFIMTFISRFQK